MKKIMFLLCVLSCTAAFAQSSPYGASRSSQPQVYEIQGNPAHASYAPLANEQSILASASYTTAQGERRASDFPQPEPAPLGDIARELKKQHAALLKKSHIVWVNQ
ncbi:MAG: hypothetical protein ABR908_13780 [Terriglobales bacterium]|jgi:hypothetical protein